MQKKNLIIIALLLILAGVLVYPRLTGGKETTAGVKDVTENPNGFLGPLAITDAVGDVDPKDNIIVLVDDGCGKCQIPVLVPFTAEQQARFETASLYSGTLPSAGEIVTAHGTLKKQDGYFVFDITKITRNGQVIISRVQN